ncbi:MAG: discoidin domain-containing protein, partial [Solirubrobacteraceae bacterium]
VHASLTARLRPLAGQIGAITLRWGGQWPAVPGPNIPPPPGPVVVLRPASYSVEVSGNGHSWRTVALIGGRSGVLDTVHLKHAVKARFVRIRVNAASSTKLPMLEELTVTS